MIRATTPEQQLALDASLRAAYITAKTNHQQAIAALEEAVLTAQFTRDCLNQLSWPSPQEILDAS